MFESAETGRKLGKSEYKRRLPQLRVDLLQAQRALRASDFPMLVVISGMDGAGKGEVLNLFHEWMDPRYLQAHAFGTPTEDERERPFYWRFWRTLPATGTIGLFMGGWYSQALSKRIYGHLDERETNNQLEQIRRFEKLLADDGALIVKFWLHLSKQAQKARLKDLAADPETAWRVTNRDRQHLKLYDAFRQAAAETLRSTSTDSAPWTVIDAADPRHRNWAVGQHLLDRLTAQLARPVSPLPLPSPTPPADMESPLGELDLTQKLPKPTYKRQLSHYQARLGRATREAVRQKRSSIIVFEGRDAAGKGGIIRRMLPVMDARYYRVIPVGAPTPEEQAHHYLWRFWRDIPRAGRATFYDRSWYGRVLVERVEGLARESDWLRAYGEINDFEEQLTQAGIVLIKFWIQISKEEQLKRFEKRERVPFKRYKITDEDYRNRARWAEYEAALDPMLQRTSTEYAPWTLIEGDDKRFARIKALETYCERLEAALG